MARNPEILRPRIFALTVSCWILFILRNPKVSQLTSSSIFTDYSCKWSYSVLQQEYYKISNSKLVLIVLSEFIGQIMANWSRYFLSWWTRWQSLETAWTIKANISVKVAAIRIKNISLYWYNCFLLVVCKSEIAFFSTAANLKDSYREALY